MRKPWLDFNSHLEKRTNELGKSKYFGVEWRIADNAQQILDDRLRLERRARSTNWLRRLKTVIGSPLQADRDESQARVRIAILDTGIDDRIKYCKTRKAKSEGIFPATAFSSVINKWKGHERLDYDIAHPNKRHRLFHATQSWFGTAGIITVSTGSSLVINGYYGSLPPDMGSPSVGQIFTQPGKRSLVLQLLETALTKLNLNQYIHLPGIVTNPTPADFVCASLVYGLAMATFYYRHNDDKYQHLFLVSGVLSGLFPGLSCGLDARAALMEFVPWAVILSLGCSAACHELVGRGRKAVEVEVEKGRIAVLLDSEIAP